MKWDGREDRCEDGRVMIAGRTYLVVEERLHEGLRGSGGAACFTLVGSNWVVRVHCACSCPSARSRQTGAFS